MYIIRLNAAVLLATAAFASIGERRTGWLDRVVQYHKQNFYKDVAETAPVKINVSLEAAPPGYKDSPHWTYESVMHLLVLISESETARPVRRALRRLMRPARRYMTWEKSHKLFPSMMKKYPNEFYYDVDNSLEYVEPTFGGVPDDDAVVMVTNPVEARLPSARISVKLLRDILDARAEAARYMPTTPPPPFSWKPMNKTAATANAEDSAGEGSGDSGSGEASDAEGSGGDGDGGDTDDGSGGATEAAQEDTTPAPA